MSEKRKPVDLGELRGVAQTAFQTWTAWAGLTPEEKTEVMALLATLLSVEVQRRQAVRAEENALNVRRLTSALEQHGEVQ